MALLALVWVLCAGYAAVIASNKGRSVRHFALAGLLLGVIGILWAAFAEDGRAIAKREQRRTEQGRAMVQAKPWMFADGL